jgi:uncharacterized membrane protein
MLSWHISERQMNKVSLTASSKITIAALVGMAAAELIGILLSQGEHPPVALVIELLLLALAALVATGRWWASGLAAGLSGLFALLSLSSSISTLAESRISEFIFAVIFLGLALVATIAGFRVTVQNYRSRDRAQG